MIAARVEIRGRDGTLEFVRRLSVLKDLRWGVAWGLAYAVIFCLFAAIVALANGSTYFGKYNLSLVQVSSLYLVGGLIAGALVGALRKYTDHAVGAMMVGLVAAVVVLMVFQISSDGNPARWRMRDWNDILIGSLVGPAAALIRWKRTHPGQRL